MLRSLTRQQRLALIAAVTFIAFTFIAALVLLITDVPPPRLTWPDLGAPCEVNAALAFRQQGVAASVSITREAMLVTVSGTSDQAWDVFSATTRLVPMGCGPYNLIRVDVPDPDGRSDVRLLYELTGPELQMWAEGQINDAQLAERMRRQMYQTVPFVTPTP
ncbi:hypothetical protein TFLX_04937 [Thermoflexales bacterium]|nr:hypothetical protein TFLX_04937 [Thermoflexales bacterium]